MFDGVRVIVSRFLPEEAKKHLQISNNVEVSEDFRKAHNKKMIKLFGKAPVIVQDKIHNRVIVNQEAFDMIKAKIPSKHKSRF